MSLRYLGYTFWAYIDESCNHWLHTWGRLILKDGTVRMLHDVITEHSIHHALLVLYLGYIRSWPSSSAVPGGATTHWSVKTDMGNIKTLHNQVWLIWHLKNPIVYILPYIWNLRYLTNFSFTEMMLSSFLITSLFLLPAFSLAQSLLR